MNAQEIYQTADGAIQGYDPVSYFDGSPRKGQTALTATYNGVIWHFVNEENKKRFQESPESFIPQYGGYCAYAVGNNYTAKSDPLAWKIVDGKLYLNYNDRIRSKWENNQDTFIHDANKNWPLLKKELEQ